MSNIDFSIDQLEVIKSKWDAFFKGELDKPIIYLDYIYKDDVYNHPVFKQKLGSFAHYPAHMSAEEIIGIENEMLSCKSFIGETYPSITLDFGPGSLSSYFGARVDVGESIWFFPNANSLEEIPNQIDRTCYWYKRAQSILDAAVSKWNNGLVQIAHTDFGANLDILSGLRGSEQLCFDICDTPDLLKQKLNNITNGWVECYEEEYLKIKKACGCSTSPLGIMSKGKTYRLQCDFGIMISNEMYEEFAMPDIKKLCDYLDDPCYHLDGKPQLSHLDSLLKIEKLRAIEFVPGAGQLPVEEWSDVYKKIHLAGKQCLSFISAKGALKLKQELGSLRGFALYIADWMPEKEAIELYNELVK